MKIAKAIFPLLFLVTTSQILSEPALAKTTLPTEAACSSPGAIVGTSGDDVLQGTTGDDVICAGSGNDKIYGLAGSDVIVGGSGNDQIDGGEGSDQITAGAGDDTVSGGSGNDSIWGENGIDIIAADDGDDYIAGGAGADHLYGGQGVDQLLGGLSGDGLDGGAGADNLNGEQGDDTCVRDNADTRFSCNFDERGPRLINISLSPESAIVDASSAATEDRLIKFRFTVVDPGTGVKSIYLGFEKSRGISSNYVSDSTNSIHMSHQYDSCETLNSAASSGTPTYGLGSNMAGYCLLAGNSNYGVYEGAALVAKNALSGTWVLANFSATDNVGNRSSLWDTELAKQKMRVKFKQIGLTDTTPPSLNSIELSGPNALKSKSDKTFVSLSYKDNKSPLSAIHLSFLGTGDASIGQTYNLSDFKEIPKCDQAYQHFACLLSGDLVDGSLKLQVYYNANPELPKWFAPRSYQLRWVTLYDSSGNMMQLDMKKSQWAPVSFMKDFWSGEVADDGDVYEPVVETLEVLTPKINTSKADQVVQLRVSITDRGVGMNFDNPQIKIDLMLKNSINNSTKSINSTRIPCAVVSKSGNANSGQYVLRCVVPARFPRGEFIVPEVSVTDGSVRSNTLFLDETTSPEASKRFPISLRNG